MMLLLLLLQPTLPSAGVWQYPAYNAPLRDGDPTFYNAPIQRGAPAPAPTRATRAAMPQDLVSGQQRYRTLLVVEINKTLLVRGGEAACLAGQWVSPGIYNHSCQVARENYKILKHLPAKKCQARPSAEAYCWIKKNLVISPPLLAIFFIPETLKKHSLILKQSLNGFKKNITEIFS